MEAKIYNYKTWIDLTEPSVLLNEMTEILKASNFEILNHVEHFFKPHGYTALWLLSESHLAIHTFPEKDSTYVELSSCNELKNEVFKKILLSKFVNITV